MTLDGRMEARIPIVMPIYLIDGRRTTQPPELALTQNVSSTGMRVVTKWRREPGEKERVTLLSGEHALSAEVVYCHHSDKTGYSVGLRLHEPCANWWHEQEKPLRLGVASRWASIWRESFMSMVSKDKR
jgi:hypothetical protein